MGRRKKTVQECEKLMDRPEQIRNIAIAAHIDYGKTTLSDNLLVDAGMTSDEITGQQPTMDIKEDGQERGITIDATNVSMTYEWEGRNRLINLTDTSGHVGSGDDVTRAMCAVDGVLVVVDAVEGTTPQTGTVLRQTLCEDIRPALLINKVDRLVNELQEGLEKMQKRLVNVISDVDGLICGMTEKKDYDWTVSVEDDVITFGPALCKWGISTLSMKETGIFFDDIVGLERGSNRQEPHERTPLSGVVLDMVAEHFFNPFDIQPYRIPTIWYGDFKSDLACQMCEVDNDGEVISMATNISMDSHVGEIATGCLFSGTICKGQKLYVSGIVGKNRVQPAGVFVGGKHEELDRDVPAGNIVAVTGFRNAVAGSTVSLVGMMPFEPTEHISEPVIMKSVEAERMDDLPKLIQTFQQVAEEDPTICIEIDEDTGEHLTSGQGKLHFEIIIQRIRDNQGVPVRTDEPTVIYCEQVQGEPHEVEGVSPDRHNRFYITAGSLLQGTVDSIKLSEISMSMPELERREALQEAGMGKGTFQSVERIHGTSILTDDTKGIQHPNETMELVIKSLEGALDDGSLATEPAQGTLPHPYDAQFHGDTIHHGPAQVIPATCDVAHHALTAGQVKLPKPIRNARIDVPSEYMDSVSGEIQGRRGRIDGMYQEGDLMVIEGITPAEEMISSSSDVCSATEGRTSWNTEDTGLRVLSDNFQREKIMEIRGRKGMKFEFSQAIGYI